MQKEEEGEKRCQKSPPPKKEETSQNIRDTSAATFGTKLDLSLSKPRLHFAREASTSKKKKGRPYGGGPLLAIEYARKEGTLCLSIGSCLHDWGKKRGIRKWRRPL